MKINPLHKNYINFKAQEYKDDGILGFDDCVSTKNREEIRNWQEEYNIPYHSLYEAECNLSEYDFNKLIKNLTKKTSGVNNEKIKSIDAYNVTVVGNKGTSYRGSTLQNKPEALKTLKNAGIERIIDLVGYRSYKDATENAGLEYYCPKFGLRYENIWLEDAFYPIIDKRSEQKARGSIERFIKLIEILQKDYFYIGCQFGTYQTDNYILLNYVFNPKAEADFVPCRDYYKIEKMMNLYKNLSPKDKARMGWTEEFDEKVRQKLKQHNNYFGGF